MSDVVFVCRAADGTFMPFEVGDFCPICQEIIEGLVAPVGPLLRRAGASALGIPVARCRAGHLLETAAGRERYEKLTGVIS